MNDVSPIRTAARRPRPWLLLLVAALIVAVGAAAFTKRPSGAIADGPKGPGGKQRPVPVLAGDVRQADVALRLAAVGTVEAMETVSVRSQVSGQVLEVGFQEGQPVSKGQLLYKLDPAPMQATLRQAEAALARSRAQLAQAEADAGRYRELLAQGFVSRQQAEQAASSVAALAATVEADRALVENAKVQLGYATITSPIAGVAGDRQVDVGNVVRAGDATPLVVINRVSPVLVSFAIPQAEIDRVRRHHAERPILATAQPRGGRSVQGQLVFLDNAVDATTGTLRLKARFPNENGALVPGQFADVVLTLATERNRIVAPAEAVQPSQTGHVAFVIQPDGTVAERAVVLDRLQDAEAIVTSGLSPGERVVTDGMLQLRDGAKVELREGLEPPARPQGKPSDGQGPKGQGPQGQRPDGQQAPSGKGDGR